MDQPTEMSLAALELAKLESVVELMMLAAYADGRVQDAEREMLKQCIVEGTKGQLRPELVVDMVDGIERALAHEGREERLVIIRRRLSDPRMRRAALIHVAQILHADQKLRVDEIAFMLRAATALEIDPEDASNILREARGSLAMDLPPRSARASVPPRANEPGMEPAVVVTGVCGRLGKRLTRHLHRKRRVVGVDRRPFPDRPKDVEHFPIDLRRTKTRDVFRSTSTAAIVHLGVMHDPRMSAESHHEWNVVGFQKLLEYVAQYRIPKLVVLSSANVYGPRPDNPQFLAEESPLLGGAAFSEIRDLIEVDMLAQSFFWKHPETETVILRPVHILGTVRNAPSNFLRLPVIPTLLGFDPMVQVVHEDDVVQAIDRALAPGVRGIFNLAGPAPLPLSHIIRKLGRTQLPLPHMLFKSAIDRMFKMHLTSFPAPELDHIRYVCMVDDARAREVLGYANAFDADSTVRAVDRERWLLDRSPSRRGRRSRSCSPRARRTTRRRPPRAPCRRASPWPPPTPSSPAPSRPRSRAPASRAARARRASRPRPPSRARRIPPICEQGDIW